MPKHFAESGRILGVALLDHVVRACGGAFHSIRETQRDDLSPHP